MVHNLIFGQPRKIKRRPNHQKALTIIEIVCVVKSAGFFTIELSSPCRPEDDHHGGMAMSEFDVR